MAQFKDSVAEAVRKLVQHREVRGAISLHDALIMKAYFGLLVASHEGKITSYDVNLTLASRVVTEMKSGMTYENALEYTIDGLKTVS
jgi:hypothetical protein